MKTLFFIVLPAGGMYTSLFPAKLCLLNKRGLFFASENFYAFIPLSPVRSAV